MASVTANGGEYTIETLSEETTVSLSLSAGELFLSSGSPQNGWRTPPKGTMEHRLKTRLDNGKLLNDGDGRLSLLLPAGDYTAEVVKTSGGGTFTLTIAAGR